MRPQRGEERRHTTNRCIDCPFFLIVQRTKHSDSLNLKIKNSRHNHDATLAETHPVHRKNAMNEKIRTEIFRQLIVQQTFFQILSSFCVLDSMIEIN